MKHFLPMFTRTARILILAMVAFTVYMAVTFWLGGERTAHALPEYATRTGEPCAACHVNAGGGGPRTLRGLLWAARGRPDAIPSLPGLLIAPNETDGLELYDIACSGCHGYSGEGLFGVDLANRGISKASTRSFIVRGLPDLGMPAFAAQFTDGQLEALVDFVVALGQGQIPPSEYPLAAPELLCAPTAPLTCRGQ